jgi:hypothetical protein
MTVVPFESKPGTTQKPHEAALKQLEDARNTILALLREPSIKDDAIGAFLKAILSTVEGLHTLSVDINETQSRLTAESHLHHANLIRHEQLLREDWSKQWQSKHDDAIDRLKAEELLYTAKIHATVADTVGSKLQALIADLLKRDRLHGFRRSMAVCCLASLVLFAAGGTFGYAYRGANDVFKATQQFEAIGKVAEIARVNAEANEKISQGILGMKATDFLWLSNLNSVIDTSVAPLPEDNVPAPCVLAVKPGTLSRDSRGKPLNGCVIALRDSVQISGGAFLEQRVLARSQQ